VEQAKSFHPDVIAAIGGGSVLDAAKALAGLITNGGSIMDYLEGVGKGKIIEKPAVPFIAAPTTSGTGTEVTKNAVISSRTMKFKKSIRHQYLIPRIAIIDPELTLTQPPDVTAACGMDALTQLIEPYVSIKSNPFTDAICLKGVELVSQSLLRAYNNGSDLEARENMCLASLMGGIALANAGLGAVHGIAAPLGAFFPLAHGVACASVLPAAFHVNSDVIAKLPGNSALLSKFADVSRILTGPQEKDDRTAISNGIAWLNDLKRELKIPTLSQLGILESDLPFIVSESRGSSMKTNPVVLSDEEIGEILRLSM
jgi:alcohol dehydrogenase class IV